MIRGGERGGRPPYPDRDRGAGLILKRLAGSRMGYQFLWIDGPGRHSAPQSGVGVFEAALDFKPRRAVRRSTRAACLSMAISPMWPDHRCHVGPDPETALHQRREGHRRTGRHALGPEPDQAPTEGPERLLVDKRYNLIRRLETVMPPPTIADAGLHWTDTSREVYAW